MVKHCLISIFGHAGCRRLETGAGGWRQGVAMAVELKIMRDFDAVAEDAGQALRRAAQPQPFDRLDWFRLVNEHTPEGDPLVIRVKNGVARCWLFLAVRGRRAESLTNCYTLRYGTVVDPADAANAPIGALSRGLRQAGISHLFLE